jgi:hypothetical protein
MNNTNSTTKNPTQVDKGQNPSSPVKLETTVEQDKSDASRQGAKIAPAKEEASSDASRR